MTATRAKVHTQVVATCAAGEVSKQVMLQHMQVWLYDPCGSINRATATSLQHSAVHVPTSWVWLGGTVTMWIHNIIIIGG